MDQKALKESDCKISKSTISTEQNDKIAWFLACQYKFMKIKCWLKDFWVVMVTNGCGHSTMSQNQTDRVNSFLDTDTNVRKLKVT